MNHYFKMSLLLCVFGSINSSENVILIKDEAFEKEAYKQYFQQQEKIYQELINLKISSARPLMINEALAESVLANSPQEVNKAISVIQQNLFFENEKDMILHGISGTGKSAIAQAIAIKSQAPCLFFNAGDMSIESLNKIFEYAKVLEKKHNKPCMIIFDELEALIKKNIGQSNYENNNLVNFWRQLDKLSDSRVVVVGTINSTESLPIRITSRTSMIEIPLPQQKLREEILFYHLKALQEKYNLTYSDSARVTAAWLARSTPGCSSRELQSIVTKATKTSISKAALSSKNNTLVMDDYFLQEMKQIKKNPERKLEREIGTWKHYFKMKFRDPRAIPVVFGMGALIVGYNSIVNQRKGLAIARKGNEC